MFLPLYSLVMEWVFPLKLSYRIESLRIWEHLMYVLHVLICGDNGISHDPLYLERRFSSRDPQGNIQVQPRA